MYNCGGTYIDNITCTCTFILHTCLCVDGNEFVVTTQHLLLTTAYTHPLGINCCWFLTKHVYTWEGYSS